MFRTQFCCVAPVLALAAALLSGCSAFEHGVEDKVSIYSFPAGASVEVDGEVVGTTPTEVSLGTLKTYQVTLTREGYEPYREIVSPARNDWGNSWIRFGLLEDTGMYNDLKPEAVMAKLRPSVVPTSRSARPYDDFSADVAQVDLMFQSGLIDSVEHKYMIAHLLNFYGGAQ